MRSEGAPRWFAAALTTAWLCLDGWLGLKAHRSGVGAGGRPEPVSPNGITHSAISNRRMLVVPGAYAQ